MLAVVGGYWTFLEHKNIYILNFVLLRFLSCLCGSQDALAHAGRDERFLSCLCGSPDRTAAAFFTSRLSELPIR